MKNNNELLLDSFLRAITSTLSIIIAITITNELQKNKFVKDTVGGDTKFKGVSFKGFALTTTVTFAATFLSIYSVNRILKYVRDKKREKERKAKEQERKERAKEQAKERNRIKALKEQEKLKEERRKKKMNF